MKTIKLSLNALVALGCLALFATSCQDDVVENNVQPNPEPQVSEMQRTLEAVLDNPSLDDAGNARLEGSVPVSYDIAITTSELDFATGGAGEVLRTIDGTLELVPVDKIGGLNVTVVDQEFQLYAGQVTFVNNQDETKQRRAAAVVLEDGTSYLLLRNLPRTGDVFTEAFVLGGDFSADNIISRNQRDEIVSVSLAGDFVEPDISEEEELETLTYNLAIIARTRVLVSQDTIFVDSMGISIPIVFQQTRLDTLDRLRGTLTLTPESIFLGTPIRFSGTFTYTTDTGEMASADAEAAIIEDNNLQSVDILDLPGSDVGDVTALSLPIELGEFSIRGLGRTDEGVEADLEDVIFEGTLIENPS